MDYFLHTFDNGIRLVHSYQKSAVAHLGFIVHTGSRDEQEHEHGMAHFIEHVIFKGTKKRKSFHIFSRLEDVGGELNAYTTKEETCIYSAFLKEDFHRAVELIHDVCFHPIFPEKELIREKNVILDEILSYRDSPSELIFDDFEDLLFQGHPIGRGILGNEKTIKKISRTDVKNFIRENYSSHEMIICSVGDIPFPKLLKIVDKYFGSVPEKTRTRARVAPDNYKPEIKSLHLNTHQVHCVIGNRAYNYTDKRRTGMHLVNNILGGPGMNSRLNMSLRERNGYSYNVESNYSPYTDSGILSIYFGCEKEKYEKSLKLVNRELNLLRNKRLGEMQLSKAKKQVLGQIAINSENREHMMLAMGKSILLFNKFESLEDIRKKIEAVSSSQILEIANQVFDPSQLSNLSFT
jgi:predicted Zn-dependent peptidase